MKSKPTPRRNTLFTELEYILKKPFSYRHSAVSAPITSELFLEKKSLIADVINHFARKILTSDIVVLKEMKQEIHNGM